MTFSTDIIRKRPRANEDVYRWHLGMVPETIERDGTVVDNPARRCAIFVVHGMGTQLWAETAAHLRSGFEDVLEELDVENPDVTPRPSSMAIPYVSEGYWADYDDLCGTFPEEVENLTKGQLEFYSILWKKRTFSAWRTFCWIVKQQVKLVSPSVIWKIHLIAWLLYIPLQFASLSVFSFMFLFKRKILSDVVGDVRLYADPQGTIERAIVQCVDKRVGQRFLRMIGLDWNFRPLPAGDRIKSNGHPVVFERVFWVAHSLGTVISYNVLSDLFWRASDLEQSGDDEQKQGVAKFRDSLRRFITLGSPLDKIAFLLGTDALKPWPDLPREELVRSSILPGSQKSELRDFWINFYQIFDPVSGALQNPLICGRRPPINFHVGMFKIPGLAHVCYWKEPTTLKYVLSRLYGKRFLPTERERHFSATSLTLLAFLGYLVWGGIVVAIASVVIRLLWEFGVFISDWLVQFFCWAFPFL